MACSKYSAFKRLICLVLAFVFAFSTVRPFHGMAASDTVYESSIVLTGDFESKRFDLSTSSDALFSLKDIAPGDTWQGRIHVKNNCSEVMAVSLVSITNNLKDDEYMFNQLDLEILLDGKLLYSGSYGNVGSSVSEWNTIEPGKQRTFEVKVILPETTGNEGQGREMDSTWIFEARVPKPESNIAPESSQIPYNVYYVDSEKNELHKPKAGYGKQNTQITEYAVSIPGYTPDAQKKTFVLTNSSNSIYFIYQKVMSSEDAALQNPSGPSDSKPTTDQVKTGEDMTVSNTLPVFGWVILFSCGLAIIITGLRIYQAKSQYVNNKDRES